MDVCFFVLNTITYFCVMITQVLLFQHPKQNKVALGATEVLVLYKSSFYHEEFRAFLTSDNSKTNPDFQQILKQVPGKKLMVRG